MRQDQGEFVSAKPGRGIRCPQVLAKSRRQPPEHVIAGGVPVGIVDRLEAVQVEHDQRHLVSFAARRVDGLTKAVEKQAAIRQVSQGIVEGPVLEISFHPPPFRDVADHRHRVGGGRSERDLDGQLSAVFAPEL
jgi:hypothetical protein